VVKNQREERERERERKRVMIVRVLVPLEELDSQHNLHDDHKYTQDPATYIGVN